MTPAATKPDADVVEEIFNQLWYEMGARLCDFQFYSRRITRLEATYGDDAVAAALRQHHAHMRRSVSDQIRRQRDHAARLKRETRRLQQAYRKRQTGKGQ
jgi:hypothetical protein